jgi:hypothetical protein
MLLDDRGAMSNLQDDSELAEQRRIRKTAFWFAVAAVLAAAVVFAFALLVVQQQYTKWEDTLEKHFAAIIGLPGAAAVAFVLVISCGKQKAPLNSRDWASK